MKELCDRIVADGEVIGSQILKVDSFLNHQIDPQFVMQLGAEIASRFDGEGVTRILTVEASGIAVAMAVGLALRVPLVFAKKSRASTQSEAMYTADVYSFTRQEAVHVNVSSRYLGKDDVVLIVDDFLAHGEALNGLVEIVRQAGAKLAGAGIIIEKQFQGGGEKLRAQGMRIESLAAITSMEPGRICFAGK
ncbi:MAG: xanthine phosphoribosyltransferase [Sporomusaceae bacterium]|nr:xanthine phosphoribosyltransferase [Sporomusaceae bacterium]